jgi:hypothetical protein
VARQKDGTAVSGEVTLLIHQGVAYTLVAWTSEDKSLDHDDLRSRFALMNRRDGWVDQRSRPRDFAGLHLPYVLTDSQMLWQPDPDKGTFFQADLALKATDPTEPDKPTLSASVVVLPLPKATDLASAVTAARAALEEAYKKEMPDAKVELEVLKGQSGPLDTDTNVGAVPGHIVRLHTNLHDDEFIVLAVVYRAGAALVIRCRCPYEKRSLWEPDFDTLIGSFRLVAAVPEPPTATPEKPASPEKPGDKPAEKMVVPTGMSKTK